MNKYPIKPPTQKWKVEAVSVFVVCSYYISSVNPAVWENFNDTDLYNGLGLMLHKPAYEIIDFIGNNYPTLTIQDGLCQIKFFESPDYPYKTGTSYDFQTFVDFTRGCTTDFVKEIRNFLVQIGYCDSTMADYYANQWQHVCLNQYLDFLHTNPKSFNKLKWIARNGTLTESEITNNINILFAYSQGVVYTPVPVWLLFKMNGMKK